MQLSDLLLTQGLVPAKPHPACFGALNTIYLPLGTQFRLELRNRAQHMEQQAPRRIVGVNLLIQDLEMDLLALQLLRNLTQVEC